MSRVRIRRFDDVREFNSRARPYLLAAEAEHNLLLGIIGQLLEGNHAYQEPYYLATIEEDDEVVGCAFRTPPHKVGITRIPEHAIPILAEDVSRVYMDVPAVMGPKDQAVAFGECWTELTGGTAEPGMRMRIYQAEQVAIPQQGAPGEMRQATVGDLALVEQWSVGFAADAGHGSLDPDASRRLIDEEGLFLWQHERSPRAMAAASGATPNGIRIGYVYTPPEHRNQGYGAAISAHVSQRQFDLGRRFCFLYTDLSNKTSNSIYQKIGYRPVGDVMDVVLG